MTVDEYLDSIKSRLLTDPVILSFRIIRERATSTDGHLRARLKLNDGGLLEFSEYIQRSAGGQISVVTYSYHWADAEGNLIRRWDNAPHFPDLPEFPHHIHDAASGAVRPGGPVSIFIILDDIANFSG